jgi:hypothetical protein
MSNYWCYTKQRSEPLRNGNKTIYDIKTYHNYIHNSSNAKIISELSLYEEHWACGKLSKSEPQANH